MLEEEPITLPDPRYRVDTIAEMEAEFETAGRFGLWHKFCRAAGAPRGRSADTAFHRDGVERLPGLTPQDAAAVRAYLAACHGENREKGLVDAADTEEVVAEDAAWVFDLLGRLIGPEVERRIQGFFRSHFFVDYVQFTRTVPADTHRPNRYWHRDAGPGAHLKIMVYFDDSRAHGSRTDFLGIGLTETIAASGYAFPDLEDRRHDLSSFLSPTDRPFEAMRGDLAAGEMILFRPRDVLHRLILPSRGERYTMTLLIQPSPLPWRDAFDLWTTRPENLRNHPWHNGFMPVLADAAQSA